MQPAGIRLRVFYSCPFTRLMTGESFFLHYKKDNAVRYSITEGTKSMFQAVQCLRLCMQRKKAATFSNCNCLIFSVARERIELSTS
jgi:hypothetical protein